MQAHRPGPHADEAHDEEPLTGGAAPERPPRGRYLAGLSLTALGVVYGDIGTSPLYAVRACFEPPHALAVSPPTVLGVLSLVVWALVVVISVKYLGVVMQAHNRGEGGILALLSLVPRRPPGQGRRPVLAAVGIVGAALLYGDGIITPAISVLSAVEGLELEAPALAAWVVPITVAILGGLFLLQHRGTSGVGRLFGPLTLAWFTSLAVLGVAGIVRTPAVLAAFDPRWGVDLLVGHGALGFLVLGAVFLVVTGGEALYADMGHFGPRPIRVAWFAVVLPALVLNYFGQGALLLAEPDAIVNPFFRLVPGWAHVPMVLLSTAATVIASQAVVSGAFSLTRQAVQLGYCPRLRITYTSARAIGQIYVPAINWALMLGTIALVLGFRSSASLAAAYGIAVSATMGITTLLLAVVARERWGWSWAATAVVMGAFLAVDAAFFGANALKIAAGGWVSVVFAAAVFTVMTTWRRGRLLLADRLRDRALPDETLVASLLAHPPLRVPGTAVFMDRTPSKAPPSLLHNVRHNKVLHERVVLLTVITEPVPHVGGRWEARRLADGIHRMTIRFGFMDDPDVPAVLTGVRHDGLEFPPMETTFFLSRDTILAAARPGMAVWRERLFAFLSRNALDAAAFFRLPPNRVVEVGAQVEL